ncbi:sporulation initiation factor Spo0A [Lacrimispora sp.]|uniref:sporulation initiation factor Spo0A n=1 Tax=Lacrimispora sp. TaxID=2719234 RepID=UPI0028AD0EB6|nr:sporulation initiation factor Spo0A [Lacrimispora sp.]
MISNKKIDKILKQVAINNGVSVEEVRKEIENAINMGKNNADPLIQRQWEMMGLKDKIATPELVIRKLNKKLK